MGVNKILELTHSLAPYDPNSPHLLLRVIIITVGLNLLQIGVRALKHEQVSHLWQTSYDWNHGKTTMGT